MEEEIDLKTNILSKSSKKSLIRLSIAGLILISGIAVYSTRNNETETDTVPQITIAPSDINVTALGRIEPLGGVIELSAPPSQGGAKVAQLLVKEGDRVKADRTVAILDNYDRLKAAVELAESEVKVATANLEIVKAGAKQGEIEAQIAAISKLEAQLETETLAQRATIDRLKAESANAEIELQRNQRLAEAGAISASNLDRFRLNLATARERVREAGANLNRITNTLDREIRQAKANLDRISEVRDVDVEKAKAELNRAIASLGKATADLEQAYVKTPIDGQILKIHAYPGEKISETDGLMEIGQTQQTIVIAEVYETDISRVKIGQKATIQSQGGAFAEKLTGNVSKIGLQIGKQDVLDTDPAADVDVRVIEVEIILDPESSRRVSGLTYAKVIANIETDRVTSNK